MKTVTLALLTVFLHNTIENVVRYVVGTFRRVRAEKAMCKSEFF
jgi:hypothetical protein